MKKKKLLTLVLGSALTAGVAIANEGTSAKCGTGKCGDSMQDSSNEMQDVSKNGKKLKGEAEKKIVKSRKVIEDACGAKKAAEGKCGTAKCGGMGKCGGAK